MRNLVENLLHEVKQEMVKGALRSGRLRPWELLGKIT